jgi:hypothetical protein
MVEIEQKMRQKYMEIDKHKAKQEKLVRIVWSLEFLL